MRVLTEKIKSHEESHDRNFSLDIHRQFETEMALGHWLLARIFKKRFRSSGRCIALWGETSLCGEMLRSSERVMWSSENNYLLHGAISDSCG